VATTEAEAVLGGLRKLADWEELKLKKPKIDPDVPDDFVYPPIEVPPLEGLALLGFDELKMRLDESQAKKTTAEAKMRECVTTKLKQQEELARLYMQRVHCNPADSKVAQGAPNVAQSLRIRTLVQIQCILSGCVPEKDVISAFTACEKDLKSATMSVIVAETFLDVAR
jgi:hypothetical protein